MNHSTIELPVLNAILCVRDPSRPFDSIEFPEPDHDRPVWATSSCLIVRCLSDCDGKTSVTLGASGEVPHIGVMVFDGWLETPGRKVGIETVLHEWVAQTDVSSSSTRVRIWTSGHLNSGVVVIGLD
ncbi:hypothetical protein [Rhodoplanes roseus]|nr:hypothetical protein [Rhodoplanes roseus]